MATDLTNQFNTPLTPEQEQQFQAWATKANRLRDLESYDMRGAWLAGHRGDTPNGHFPDTYKKPNHTSFSSESQYSTPDNPGGKWSKDAQGKWTFEPTAANYRYRSRDELRQYFKQYEPDSRLKEREMESNMPPALKVQLAQDAYRQSKGLPPLPGAEVRAQMAKHYAPFVPQYAAPPVPAPAMPAPAATQQPPAPFNPSVGGQHALDGTYSSWVPEGYNPDPGFEMRDGHPVRSATPGSLQASGGGINPNAPTGGGNSYGSFDAGGLAHQWNPGQTSIPGSPENSGRAAQPAMNIPNGGIYQEKSEAAREYASRQAAAGQIMRDAAGPATDHRQPYDGSLGEYTQDAIASRDAAMRGDAIDSARYQPGAYDARPSYSENPGPDTPEGYRGTRVRSTYEMAQQGMRVPQGGGVAVPDDERARKFANHMARVDKMNGVGQYATMDQRLAGVGANAYGRSVARQQRLGYQPMGQPYVAPPTAPAPNAVAGSSFGSPVKEYSHSYW